MWLSSTPVDVTITNTQTTDHPLIRSKPLDPICLLVDDALDFDAQNCPFLVVHIVLVTYIRVIFITICTCFSIRVGSCLLDIRGMVLSNGDNLESDAKEFVDVAEPLHTEIPKGQRALGSRKKWAEQKEQLT